MSREIIFILAQTENKFSVQIVCFFLIFFFFFDFFFFLLQVPLHDVFVSHQQMLFIQNMSIYFI